MTQSSVSGKSTNVRASLRKRYRKSVHRLSMDTIGASVGTLAKVAPGVALDVATFLFFKPMRTASRAREIATLEAASPLRVKLRNRTLHGWSWGLPADPPVLLVHGWSGRAGQLSAFVEPFVRAGRRVVAFDLSGHGASSGEHASIVALAEDLLAIGAHLGPFDAVVAHSFGGPVTTLAMVAGLEVKRAVFIAPPFDATEWVEGFSRWLGFDDRLKGRLRRRLERRVGLSFGEVSHDHIAPTMTTPLLVIHDDDDRDVSVVDGERLAATWPGATFHRTQGLGHQRILGDAEVVALATRFAVFS